MTRGRKADPQREARGTGHHPNTGEAMVEYAKQTHSLDLQRTIAKSLPEGQARDVFERAVMELGDKARDTDLEAIRLMAWHLHRSLQAQAMVEELGMMVETEWGPRVNPMLKVARDEGAAYIRIAEKYALTFESRLRAGILQVAGQSILQELHSDMAAAIVARIVTK